MSKNPQDLKLTFEDEINLIFKSVYQKQITIKPKTYTKIKQLMKINAQDIVGQALKRAARRQANLNILQSSDLIWAIQRRGEKYKMKVGKSLVTANNFSEFGQKKMMTNYQYQQGDEIEDQNQK